MAAAMRFASRRLIGGERAQAAYKAVLSPLVQEERRRLMPSLINGGRPAHLPRRSMSSAAHPPNGNTPPKQPCAKPASDRDAQRAWAHRQITEIETKKQDLFYQLAELHTRFPSRDKYFRDNRELIHHLFGHVEPNPSDALWRFARRREIFNKCLVYGYAPTRYTGAVAKENIRAGIEKWEQSVDFGVKMFDNFNPAAKIMLGVMTGVAAVKSVPMESTEPKVRIKAVGSSLLLEQAEEPGKDV